MVLTVAWQDGFDHYPVAPAAAPFGLYSTWQRAGTTLATAAFEIGFKGRGQAAVITASGVADGRLQRGIPPANQISQHIALNMHDMDGDTIKPLFSWRDSAAAIQFGLWQMPTGKLALYRGNKAALLAQTGHNFQENVVHRLNFAIDFTDPASGDFQLWVDGDRDIKGFNLENTDLLATANTTVDMFCLEQEGYGAEVNLGWKYKVDDAVFCYGAAQNIGELELVTQGPSSDILEEWTPSAGADNYANVDEIPPSTADYNSSAVVGNTDLQGFPALPTAPDSIFCLTQIIGARKEEAGTRTLAAVARPLVTEYDGANQNLTTDDIWYYQHYLQNPQTAAAWLVAERAAAAFGYKDVA